MVTFAIWDWLILALFGGAILALGFSARLKSNTVLQFLAVGRQLTLPFFVVTLVSTWYGGILGMGESVAYFGTGTWLLLGLPYYVFAVLYALVLARRVREADQISLPERLDARFGRTAGAVGAGLVTLLAAPAAHVLMLGTLLQVVTGWSLTISVIVAVLVGFGFLYRGGLLADVRVSTLAFLMMYLGFGVMVVTCLVRLPFGDMLARLEPAQRTLDGGAGWIGVLGFFVLGAWTFVDPGFHQRVASAASPEVGRRGVFVATICWVVFDLLTITAGLYALALLKPAPEAPLLIFPLLGEQLLAPGLKAIFFCGMVGTILSAMVGYSLVCGATVGRDLIARLRGITDDGRINAMSKAGIAVASLLAAVLALQVESVVNLWYHWGGCVIGALLLPVGLAYVGPQRVSSVAIVASMIVGFGGSLGWMIAGYRSGNTFLMVRIGGSDVALGTLVPSLILAGATLAVVSLGHGRHLRRIR